MKLKAYAKWIFAEELPESGVLVEFVESQPFIKDGKEKGEVLCFLGGIGDFVGDLQIFPSNIANLKGLIKELGDDTENWKQKRFIIKPTPDKKKVSFGIVAN